MPEPTPWRTELTFGHVGYIIYRGNLTVKNELDGTYGIHFDTEIDEGDTLIYCLIKDPRYRGSDLMNYIVELGGEVLMIA